MRLPRGLSRRALFRGLTAVALACGVAAWASSAQRKKKPEDVTQTLQLPKDLPATVSGETRRLTFYVTPLSGKGLLTPQIREALKALSHQTGSDTVLKIRAFVAGSGDVRRVRDLVSEVFSDRKQPLPALSLIRSGGLGMEGSQVVLEAIAQSRKEVNPHGLAFISAQIATAEDPLSPVAPLTADSLAKLRKALTAAGADASGVVRVTCFLSSLENLAASRGPVTTEFPHAAVNFVQTQRAPGQALAACEAVARLGAESGRMRFLSVDGLAGEPGRSEMALVGAPQVVLTGSQVSFGYQEQDGRLAFERLGRELTQAGASFRDVAFAHYYPLSNGTAAQVRKLRAEMFDKTQPPAGTLLLFEGLPSMDAGFAVDAVAVK
jgi:enamine deaminase RidA (YjgF/YER057c/UK114 family)